MRRQRAREQGPHDAVGKQVEAEKQTPDGKVENAIGWGGGRGGQGERVCEAGGQGRG